MKPWPSPRFGFDDGAEHQVEGTEMQLKRKGLALPISRASRR